MYSYFHIIGIYEINCGNGIYVKNSNMNNSRNPEQRWKNVRYAKRQKGNHDKWKKSLYNDHVTTSEILSLIEDNIYSCLLAWLLKLQSKKLHKRVTCNMIRKFFSEDKLERNGIWRVKLMKLTICLTDISIQKKMYRKKIYSVDKTCKKKKNR